MCSSVQVYALGSEAEIELAVAVENRGEDAFEATVRIFKPDDVDYISVGDIAAPVSSYYVHLLVADPENSLSLDILIEIFFIS